MSSTLERPTAEAAEAAVLQAFHGQNSARVVDVLRTASLATAPDRARKAFWNLVSEGRIVLEGSQTIRLSH